MRDDHPIVKLAAKIEPVLRHASILAIDYMQSSIDVSYLADDIRSGHHVATQDTAIAGVLRLGETLEPIIKQAFLHGANYALSQLHLAPKSAKAKDVSISLSMSNPAAVAYARLQAGELVTNTTESAKESIRIIIANALQSGEDPYTAARIIRSIVGLNDQQALAVEHYWEALQEKIDAGELDLAQGLARVDRYAVGKIRERADMIARTEAITALNKGQQALWEQAAAHGQINTDITFRQWIASLTACPEVCLPMDSNGPEGGPAEVQLDEPFILPDGSECMVPGMDSHPNCSCTVGLVFHRAGDEDWSGPLQPGDEGYQAAAVAAQFDTIVEGIMREMVPAKASLPPQVRPRHAPMTS